jgi:hypothetical protein
LSSTIDRQRRAEGQVLVLFAGGIALILLVAALVFDVGMVLFQQRSQQDASDAAALAGARWMVDTSTSCKSAPSIANCPNAVQAAMAIAAEHGYDASQVTINIPPVAPSRFAGASGHIEVSIRGHHQSWFAGIAGPADFNIGTRAVAANTKGYSLPYSFLALNPTCANGGNSSVSGNGTVLVGGAIQVDATGCGTSGAFTVNGGGSQPISVSAAGGCGVSDTSPGYKSNGSGVTVDCPGLPKTGVPPVPDPLSELGVNLGTIPDASDVQIVSPVNGDLGNSSGCPGQGQAGTKTSPKTCTLSFINGSANTVTTIILSPGVYWGGINIKFPNPGQTLNVYLLPGIYAMAGGGFSAGGSGGGIVNVRTIVSPSDQSFGGGVLIYNTDDPAACPGSGCIQDITVTGGTNPSSSLQLKPYQFDPYKSLLIYQERNASSQPDISLIGATTIDVQGTIYAPKALLKVSGQGSGIAAQIIAGNFAISGNGGLDVTYNSEGVYKLTGVGLVE